MKPKYRFDFFDMVVRRHLLTTAVTLLMISVLAAGVTQLITVNVSVRNHFNEDDPYLINLEKFEETYAVSDSVLVIVAPPNETVFTLEALVAIDQLTEALWRAPNSVRVDSITNYLHTEGTTEGLIVERLVDNAASLDDAKIERIREIALTSQETSGRFVSRDGRLAGVIVSLQIPDEGREQARIEVVDALYGLVNDQRAANPDIEYHMYGEPLLNRAVRDALNTDMSTLAPIAFVMMTLAAILLLRSVWSVLGVFAILIAVVASSFGFSGWIGLRLYAESGAAVFILMAIATAHSVHLIQGMADAMRRGVERAKAIAYSLRTNVRPIFLTSITTMIGFLSLNFSEMPPFRVMGNVVALGAIFAFVYSVTLLPALLALMPIRVPSNKQQHGSQFSEWLGHLVISNRNLLLWTFLILSLVGFIGVSRINLDDNNNAKLLDQSYELRRSGDFISQNFSGLDTFEYSLSSGREGGITEIAYLNRVDSFAQWLREQPEVSHVTAITDTMKRINQNLHNDEVGAYVLPANSDLAAQYLFLYELSLPVGRDLNNLVNFERSATRMTVVVEEMSVTQQIELDQRASAWLQSNATEMGTGATGVAIVGAYSVMRNIVNMLLGTFIAMSIVSLLLIFAFKSLRFGFLSLIPNFFPAIIAMGIWGYAVGTVTIAASIVTAIAFAIIVDDTIHIMSKYLKSRAEGKSASDAIVPTFKLVGRPLLSTTLIFALAFFVFGASGLETNETLGLLVGITVTIALVADFLLFPPLLLALDNNKANLRKGVRPERPSAGRSVDAGRSRTGRSLKRFFEEWTRGVYRQRGRE